MPNFGTLRVPRNIVFGAGQRRAVAGYGRELGSRALIVTDERLGADRELRDLVDALAAAGVRSRVFAGTMAELPLDCLGAGCKAGASFGADLVIGFGGGSCLDAGKVIALILAHGGQPKDYYGEFAVPGPILPVIALPTTAGTGSEVTPVAVVGDPERAVKVGIASPHLIPHTAICDPELTYSCPPGLTAASGADAMTHAIEAFTNLRREATGSVVHEHVFVGKNALSDHFALLAISHLAAGLKRACDEGGDIEARERVMLGSLSAGLAFGTAGTAAAHAVQYPVGAMTHTAHGVGVAVMMPYVMAFNRDHCEGALAEIARAMGLASDEGTVSGAAVAAVEGVRSLFASIGIPRTIAELGVREDQLALVAEQALGSVRLVKNNPRPLDAASMRLLVDAAFHGGDPLADIPFSETRKAS
ncbi:iron-containing alcohol dehydrogenase [Aureimonas populi]|uniref:Iron-containing alcohol dehydrogenase n=1 Tax=Aureimonas populi TaxID=1701758 RepID=A0ABW5CRN9_9HYPH|nr:iron-containing alcohol dehydrogenase [Aureimonas populi]